MRGQNSKQAQLPPGETTESEVKKNKPVPNSIVDRKTVSTAISEYLADCDDRQGKSGYGLAPRTPETYEFRLGFLSEFRPKKDELIFKFFLHSMAREMEVAHCEVRDLKFDINVLHICPKPDRNFRLKGKRSGQAKKGRKVPIPAIFMSRLKTYCTGKGPRQLLFPNGLGGVEQ